MNGSEDDITSPEVREMVDSTVEMLRRQVGAVRSTKQFTPSAAIQQRLERIAKQASVNVPRYPREER